jgi:hypothetical protein
MAWESIVAFVKEIEDQASLSKMEARERVLRMEVESATVLASAREEAEGFAWSISLLEGELAEVCQALDTNEPNSRDLFDMVADMNQRWEEAERSANNGFKSLPFCKPGVLSCARP